METVSLIENTRLEFAGAEQRLARARASYLEFRQLHCAMVNGEQVFLSSDLNLRNSLDRQHYGLVLELDESTREFHRVLAKWAELQGGNK